MTHTNMSHTHITNTQLPRLSESRIEQMATFACSHTQESVKNASTFAHITAFFASPMRVFASAGLATTAFACLAIVIFLPAQMPNTSDITYSENTISEYIIQDFLDEIA